MLRELVFPRWCIGCGRDGVLLCRECASSAGGARRARLAGLEVVSCVAYEGLIREAIAEFKRGRRAFADDLALILQPFAGPGMTLVPIPTTRRRRAERGFDQTRLLAEQLRRSCGVRVADFLLRGAGPAQHGRSRVERLAAAGRFRVRRTAASSEDLVLFDDVRTTGATLLDAAATLRAAGLPVRVALTLAWTPEDAR
ncbi:MAG: ComF family protein [Candidatus Eremiobacteraeota bacterium]|nr:ComF family protein [Candidatus Eremiobacteraeota bacterium]